MLRTTHFFTLTGLTQGQTIHYRVRSSDQYANEIVSPDRTIVIEADRENPEFTMSPPIFGTGQATLTFVASELSHGTFSWGIADAGENTVTLASSSSPALVHTATMTGLTNGQSYLTRLVLADVSGNFVESNSSLYYPGPVIDTTPPSVPLGLRISGFDKDVGVTLKWNANSELDMAGYNLMRRPATASGEATGPWEAVNASLLTEEQFTDETLDVLEYWQYTVSAEDQSANESAMSSPLLYDPEMWVSFDFVAVSFPNPFRVGTGTQISFRAPAGIPGGGALTGANKVSLTVYDVSGRRIKLLYAGNVEPGKTRTVRWNGKDQGGNALAAGVYFYRLETATTTMEKKMILLR